MTGSPDLSCALTLAHVPLDDIAAITLGDVSADGATATVGGEPVVLPPGAACAARAARFLRRAEGAAPSDLLFPYSTKTLARFLADASADVGVHVQGRIAERASTRPIARLRRLGITIGQLL